MPETRLPKQILEWQPIERGKEEDWNGKKL